MLFHRNFLSNKHRCLAFRFLFHLHLSCSLSHMTLGSLKSLVPGLGMIGFLLYDLKVFPLSVLYHRYCSCFCPSAEGWVIIATIAPLPKPAVFSLSSTTDPDHISPFLFVYFGIATPSSFQ